MSDIEVHVTRVYHKDGPDGEPRGSAVVSTMTFEDFDAAMAFGYRENAGHADKASHITNVYLDAGNFCCFDISDIWDTAGDGFLADYDRLNPRTV